MADMKTTNLPSCAFTNAKSNREQKVKAGICIGTSSCINIRKQSTYVGCVTCSSDHTTIWRCTQCYILLQKYVTKKNIVPIPVIRLLFLMDFADLTESRIDYYCLAYPNNIKKSIATWNNNSCVLIFTNGCPCCYKFLLPTIKQPILAPPDSKHRGLFGLEMIQSIKKIELCNTYYIKDSSVKLNPATITIGVVVLNQVVSLERQNEFLHHVITNQNTSRFLDIEYVVQQKYGVEYNEFNVLLILGEITHTKRRIVLSMKFLNCYNHFIEAPKVSIRQHISYIILLISRLSVSEKQNFSPSRVLNKNAFKKLTIEKPKFRTNRTGGALGNMNGEEVDDIRNKLFGGEAVNNIPKTKFGQITIPYYKKADSKLICQMVPYYMSVKVNTKASKPRMNARPTMGWLIDCKRYFNKYDFLIRINKVFKERFIINNVYTNIMKELIYAPYNAALLWSI